MLSKGPSTFDQKLETFLLCSCLMGDVLFLWTAAYQMEGRERVTKANDLDRLRIRLRIKHVWYIIWGMCTTLAQRLGSIMFDETCFNRLATHFNTSMLGHRAVFVGVRSSKICRLFKAFGVKTPSDIVWWPNMPVSKLRSGTSKVKGDPGGLVRVATQRQVQVDWYKLHCFGSPTPQLAHQHLCFCTMWPDRAEGLLAYRTPGYWALRNFLTSVCPWKDLVCERP